MKKLIYIIVFVILNGTIFSQIDRTSKPEPGPNPNFTLPKIQKSKLNNGLEVMLVEKSDLPLIQMQFVFQTGCGQDPADKPGVANMTMKLLDAGTKRLNALQIADEFDFLGARFNASTNYDGSFVTILTLNKHLEKVLEITSEIFQNAAFPQEEFDRIRKEIITGLIQQQDRPDIIVNKVFSKIIYEGDHPYGKPVEGTAESLEQITVEDLKNYYDLYFKPNNAVLIVVGDITLEKLTKTLEKYLGKWTKTDLKITQVPEPSANTSQGIYIVDKAGAPQSQIRVGAIGVKRNTPDYFALEVLNTILGGNFNSRINWNLREQKGYTYGARSNFVYRKQAGPFSAGGGFKSNVTDECVSEILAEISRMKNSDISIEELEFAKNSLMRSLPRAFETSGQIAGQLNNLVLYNLPDDYFNTYIRNIEKITIEEVRKVSEKYLHPENMVVVIVGDVQLTRESLEKLNIGKINIMDHKGNLLE